MSFWPFKTNFSLIAENTTKYYTELKGRYKERFADDASLLAAAGVLDAQNYIFSSPPQIDITDIIELARECTTKDENHTPIGKDVPFTMAEFQRFMDSFGPPKCTPEVFAFVFGLELLLFKADNNKFSEYDIHQACLSKHKTIEKAITRTLKKYTVGKGVFAETTTTFMQDVSLEPLRNSLGILP